VEGTGDLTSLLNRLSTKLQTGSTGFYILVMSIAVAAILILNMGTEIADQFFSIFNAQTK
jgi:hypothetical protein